MNICEICGANYTYKNGKWICPACDHLKSEKQGDEEVVLIANASSFLRLGKFDQAFELYKDVIKKYPFNSDAYWGAMLSKFGIKYEDDAFGKKIPTIYNTSIQSVLTDEYYLKAIETSDPDQKLYYIDQANQIEKIRIEWLEKANKEPPYDVFICYKDSDPNLELERTPDSYEAQNLYTHLSSLGYRVFYSRESLRSKVSENWEPYIFNALITSKVMVLYVQNSSYASSPWIQNEWKRFANLIDLGEKQPNSLVVAYENFDVSELPQCLRSKQCMDASKKTFYGDLERHIKKVLHAAEKRPAFEKIDFVGNQTSIKVESVESSLEVHEINSSIQCEPIDSDDKLLLIHKLISNNLIYDATEMLDEYLLENPHNGEALKCKLLLTYNCTNINELKKIKSFVSIELLEEILTYANPSTAEEIINCFYDLSLNLLPLARSNALSILKTITPYNYSNRNAKLSELFNYACNNLDCELFDFLLITLLPNDVDAHIANYENFIDCAIKKSEFTLATTYVNRLLQIENGNICALRALVRIETSSSISPKQNKYDIKITKLGSTELLENIFKFQSKEDMALEIENIVCEYVNCNVNKTNYSVLYKLLQYYPLDFKNLSNKTLNSLIKIAETTLENNEFDIAEELLNIVISVKNNNSNALWLLTLKSLKCKSTSDFIASDKNLSDSKYFKDYLNSLNDDDFKDYKIILEKHEDYINKLERIRYEREQNNKIREEKRLAEEEKLRLEKERLKLIIAKKTAKFKSFNSFLLLFNLILLILKNTTILLELFPKINPILDIFLKISLILNIFQFFKCFFSKNYKISTLYKVFYVITLLGIISFAVVTYLNIF